MNFRSYEIKDICKIKSGKRLPKGTDFSEKPTKHKYIRARDIKNGKIDGSDLGYISEETQKKIERYIVNTNDIIITIAGTIGEVALVSKKFDGVNLTENAVRLTEFSKDVCPEFLAYILKSPERKEYMEQVAGGSAQPKLGIYKIEAIKVDLPDVQIQHKIADILSAYDNLIENNQKQIKLLEEAAQRLYKEWFVDLRFPGHENTKIVDGVPEGWIKEEIGKIIKKVHRTKQIVASEYKDEGSIPIVDQSRAFVAGYTNDLEARVDFGIPIIVFGDHTRIVKLIQFPFAKGADGTQLIISDCLEMPQRLLYCSIMNVDLSNYHYARHFKYLKEEKIMIPTVKVANEFENNVTGIFSKIQNCRDEIIRCQKTRDLLLPKLMSGEVEV